MTAARDICDAENVFWEWWRAFFLRENRKNWTWEFSDNSLCSSCHLKSLFPQASPSSSSLSSLKPSVFVMATPDKPCQTSSLPSPLESTAWPLCLVPTVLQKDCNSFFHRTHLTHYGNITLCNKTQRMVHSDAVQCQRHESNVWEMNKNNVNLNRGIWLLQVELGLETR